MSESETDLFHEAPATLDVEGQRVWESIAAKYELRPDELVTLEDICLISDMILALEQAWFIDGKPMTTKGSMGQQVIHPMVGEIRTQRMARNALWRQLKLPDVDAPAGEGAQPNQQRGAAQTRWGSRGA